MASRYDLAVIGGGTAGLVSAAGATSLGARVALVERDKLGGDCLHNGCVPTKALVKSARVAILLDHSEEYGVRTSGYEVDFPAVMERMAHLKRTAGENDDPDRFLYVYAVAADDANDVKTVLNAGFLDLGMLKGNRGIRATTCRIASTPSNIG